MTLSDGAFALAGPIDIVAPANLDARIQQHIVRFAAELPVDCRIESQTDRANRSKSLIRFATDYRHNSDESYRLAVEPGVVTINGASAAGLFYGLQTLRQIAQTEGAQWGCRIIEDAPDLPVRGLSYDVSRGKVPTVDTLKWLVDLIASLKMNHLQLYVEHTFDFRFDPDIARGCSPLTREDIQTIQSYCHDRFVEFVPSIATLGHMGRILSLPRYRPLAEVPPDRPWEEQSWLERTRGLTLDVTNPAGRRLIESMLDEFLPLFDSPVVNVCGDEPHDLGRGKGRSACEQHGRERLYADHIRFLADVCRRHAKRVMLWGDVVSKNPRMINELPDDAILLDWGYEADADFPIAASAECARRKIHVCPGTSCWNRIIGAMNAAEANIANAVRSAKRNAAGGLIVTDWGDHGHFHSPATALPQIAQAAAGAWNASEQTEGSLDRAIGWHVLTDRSGRLLPTLRTAARLDDRYLTWPALYRDIRDPDGALLINPADADLLKGDARNVLETLAEEVDDGFSTREWRLACQASMVLADKIQLAHEINGGKPNLGPRLRALADHIDALRSDFEDLWRLRNKPHRMGDVSRAFKTIGEQARGLAGVSGSARWS